MSLVNAYRRLPLTVISAYGKTLLLVAAMLVLYMPHGLRDVLFFIALVIAYRQRDEIQIDAGLKNIFWLFIGYIFLFTVLSSDIKLSAKGLYDMIRGMLFFFPAYILAQRLEDKDQLKVLSLLVVAAILAHFLFGRDAGEWYFYGYHANSNNSAVTLTVYTVLAMSLLAAKERPYQLWLLGIVGLAAGLYLLLLTNARGAWLGVFFAILVCVFVSPILKPIYKWGLGVGLTVMLLSVILLANQKGYSLSLRDHIWGGLFYETIERGLWLGFGLNSVKSIMTALDLPTLTAHNIFLEVFVSSGLVGLALVVTLIGLLVRHLLSYRYRRNPSFYIGAGGLTAYLTMAQFDLKLSSFLFMASISIFLAFVYAQRITPRSQYSDSPYSSSQH